MSVVAFTPSQKFKFKLRRWIQRLHLVTTLILGLFIAFEIATGTVLLFWDQLEAAFYPQLLQATPSATVNYQGIYTHLRAAYPAWETIEMGNLGEQTAIKVSLADYDEMEPERTLYFDPGTGQINGELANPQNILYFVWRLHKNLWLETHIGAPLLALLAGIPLIVMLLTGLYLWFPRFNTWSAVFRLRRQNAFLWNYSLHRLMGIAIALPLLIIVTPMLCGYNLGDAISPVYRRLGLQVVPEPEMVSTPQGNAPLPLDRLIQAAQNQYPDGRVTRLYIDDSTNPTGVVSVTVELPDHPARGAQYADVIGLQLFFEQYTGQILATYDPRDWPLLTRLLTGDWMFGLHYGTWGGVITRTLEACVGILALCLAWTGIRQWSIKRQLRLQQKR
ncbi:MAG: PepSY domain-containing protein [Acaryochloris sp. RU_4_1]|nr:PepSY domain-containing protein [Acaryochloris sp. RU_4_1]NJR54468.1 PepSY domain-containing protein [Acaryochloris sp. CRU_2_0]